MTLLRGLVGVLVALAISVGAVQFLELMLANALAGHPLQSLDDYAAILNTLPVIAIRVVVSSFLALLAGYLCAKVAEHDEMRYTLIAVIFRVITVVAFNKPPFMPHTPLVALAVLLAVSSVAMLAGGGIRAAAASVERRRAGAQTPQQGEKL